MKPFFFDGNLWFGEVRTDRDLESLLAYYAVVGGTNPMDARTRNDSDLPYFSFRVFEGVTLREWLKVSNGS